MDLWKCAIVRNLFEKKTKHLALAFLKKKKRKKSIDHHILWMACWISSGTTGRCFFWNNYFPFVFTGTIQHLSIALRWIWICSVTLSVVFWRSPMFIPFECSTPPAKIFYFNFTWKNSIQSSFTASRLWMVRCVLIWFNFKTMQAFCLAHFEQTFHLHFLENNDKVLC